MHGACGGAGRATSGCATAGGGHTQCGPGHAAGWGHRKATKGHQSVATCRPGKPGRGDTHTHTHVSPLPCPKMRPRTREFVPGPGCARVCKPYTHVLARVCEHVPMHVQARASACARAPTSTLLPRERVPAGASGCACPCTCKARTRARRGEPRTRVCRFCRRSGPRTPRRPPATALCRAPTPPAASPSNAARRGADSPCPSGIIPRADSGIEPRATFPLPQLRFKYSAAFPTSQPERGGGHTWQCPQQDPNPNKQLKTSPLTLITPLHHQTRYSPAPQARSRRKARYRHFRCSRPGYDGGDLGPGALMPSR